MNRLVVRLLRQQISWGQLLGFFVANLLGMGIVLLSFQFYIDVSPVFSQGDSFMKETYLVLGKRVTTAQTLFGGRPQFTAEEIDELQRQPFVKSVGAFVPAQFDVYASVGSRELGLGMSTEMFFEAVPDNYIDADLSQWHYEAGSDSLPIILPRNYLNLYNFGFANSRGLPAVSESMVGMIKMNFRLRGTQGEWHLKGKVVDFSDRINTILVPKSFMDRANAALSPERDQISSRLIVEVDHPADDRIATFLSSHQYEDEGSNADNGRMAYFLRMIIGIVLIVGVVICTLSFYVLLLSIYLLLQKHTEKIDTLLLIGYTPGTLSLPFHLLSGGLNLFVFLLSLLGVAFARDYYLPRIAEIYPQLTTSGLLPSFLLGLVLFFLVAGLDYFLIRRKVKKIWYIHRERRV